MALILNALTEILRKPTIGDIVTELTLFAAPLWIAVFVGILVGWAWKPKWAVGMIGQEKGSSDDDGGEKHHEVNPNKESNCCSGLQLVIEILYSLRAWLPIHGQLYEKEEKNVEFM